MPYPVDAHLDQAEIQAEELQNKLSTIKDSLESERRTLIFSTLKGLLENGAQPFKIFNTIIGERTRADNIGCGINGAVDHEIIANYFKKVAEQEDNPKKQAAYDWISNEGDFLQEARELVLDFLLIDQQTNEANYSQNGFRISESSIPSSLSETDMPNRVLPDRTKKMLIKKLDELKNEAKKWQKKQTQYKEEGLALLDMLKNPQASLLESDYEALVSRGSYQEDTVNWTENLENLEKIADTVSHIIEQPTVSPNVLLQTMYNLLTSVTAAEAILEHQYYWVGFAKIRSAMSQ